MPNRAFEDEVIVDLAGHHVCIFFKVPDRMIPCWSIVALDYVQADRKCHGDNGADHGGVQCIVARDDFTRLVLLTGREAR